MRIFPRAVPLAFELVALAALAAVGCSSSSSPEENKPATGGQAAVGGASAARGGENSAGAAAGSQATSGGTAAQGGAASTSSGGAHLGGASTRGGETSAGGTQAGGANAAGGKASGSGGKNTGGKNAGGSANGGASSGSGGAGSNNPCDAPGLVWKSANKTNYTSYPDPGSEECIKYNGCTWAGQFAACNDKKPEAWVSSHNIVAAFPDFGSLELHDLCLRKGTKTLVVTVLDTCGDSDCDGCCTQNKGNADELIDIESYTDQRWGVPDGRIEWADLGPTTGDGCR